MKKMYIITNSSFPYGNANSNYIRYFSLALIEQGWKVMVIGSNMFCGNSERGEYRGILFHNLQFSGPKIPFHLKDHLLYGNRLRKELNNVVIEKEAHVFVYSMYKDLVSTVLKELKNHLQEGHLSIGMVEWFQPFQYRFGKLNPDYICWKYTFERLVPQYPKVFPISRKLQEYYGKKGCKTMLLPAMADAREHAPEGICVQDDLIRHFIYPGNAKHKDALDGAIQALGMLDEEEITRVRFHLTTISQEEIAEYVNDKKMLKRISPALVFHGLLSFTGLLQLYQSMDFLLLPREKNLVTLSNFPSKIPEVMCYAIIPVCSAVGDYADLYLRDNVDSILFEGADSISCLNGLRRALGLSKSELLNMKKAARYSAESRFDYRNWADIMEEFLQA